MGGSEFDRYRERYRSDIDDAVKFSGQDHDFFLRAKARVVLDTVSDYRAATDAPVRLLDVGCGHGLIHPHLLELADGTVNITGVDNAATVIEDARSLHPHVRYDCSDGQVLPYADDSFDAAMAICVMHHVPADEWVGFLQEMRRVVRKGGAVLVLEHNPFNPLTQWIVNTCPLDINAKLLSSRRTRRLMHDAGLLPAARRYILFTPFNGRVFQKIDRFLGWMPLGAQYMVSGIKPEAA